MSVLTYKTEPAAGPLFTKMTDALPQDLVKTRNREIRVYTFLIALKFDRHLGSAAAEMPVNFLQRCDHYNIQSSGFETSWDLAVRRVNWWIQTQLQHIVTMFIIRPTSTLTHSGRVKMDAISQMIFLKVFSLMKKIELRLEFHWILFLRF